MKCGTLQLNFVVLYYQCDMCAKQMIDNQMLKCVKYECDANKNS